MTANILFALSAALIVAGGLGLLLVHLANRSQRRDEIGLARIASEVKLAAAKERLIARKVELNEEFGSLAATPEQDAQIERYLKEGDRVTGRKFNPREKEVLTRELRQNLGARPYFGGLSEWSAAKDKTAFFAFCFDASPVRKGFYETLYLGKAIWQTQLAYWNGKSFVQRPGKPKIQTSGLYWRGLTEQAK